MKYLHRFFFVATAFLVVALYLPEAFAQSATTEHRIDFRPLMDQVVWPAIVAVATAIAGVLVRKLLGWLKLSEDRMVREYLEVALVNGLELARQRLGSVPLGMTTKSQLVAEAANYVIGRVPDALKRFDIDEAALKRLVEARVASIEPLAAASARLDVVK